MVQSIAADSSPRNHGRRRSRAADGGAGLGGLSRASLPRFRRRRGAANSGDGAATLTKERLQLVVNEIASLREYKQRLADTSTRALERRQLPLYERLSSCLATVRSMLQLFFRYYCLRSGVSEAQHQQQQADGR